jgi:hypothetical protein
MRIYRRQFLAMTGVGLTGWLAGCSRSAPVQPHKLESWDRRTGATLNSQEVQIPKADWQPLDSSGHGFLLANGSSVLAMDLKGGWKLYEGPDDARWVRPDLLVTAEHTSSAILRVRAQEFPSGRIAWTQDLTDGFLLGNNADAVYAGHKQGVSCFDLAQGREVWKNPAMTELKSAYVAPDSLVLGQGYEGKVTWNDLKTGKELRRVQTNKTFNRVVLLVGDGQTTLAVTRHVGLAGYRPNSPDPVWVQPLGEMVNRSKLLAFGNGVAVIEMFDSSLAVDLASGRKLWGDSLCPVLSLSGDVVLMRRGQGLGAGELILELEGRDLHTGGSLWKRQLKDLEAKTAVNGDQFAILTI